MKKLLSSISQRYSPYSFQDKMVSTEDLNILFEAVRHAASSYNDQPWNFIYATKDEPQQFNKLLEILVDQNQKWAKTAPVLMLSVAKKDSAVTGKSNPYRFHDTGMAMGNLLNQATSMGIYVHQMGGYKKQQAVAELNIPDDYEPVAMIALGYPADEDKSAEKDRKEIQEFVFKGTWK